MAEAVGDFPRRLVRRGWGLAESAAAPGRSVDDVVTQIRVVGPGEAGAAPAEALVEAPERRRRSRRDVAWRGARDSAGCGPRHGGWCQQLVSGFYPQEGGPMTQTLQMCTASLPVEGPF
jgi:hypothetical protein